jgi:hypothetical protein
MSNDHRAQGTRRHRRRRSERCGLLESRLGEPEATTTTVGCPTLPVAWMAMPAFGLGVGVYLAVRPVGGAPLAGLAACCSAALILAGWYRYVGGCAAVDAALVVAMGVATVRHRGPWTAGSLQAWLDTTLVVAVLLLVAVAAVAGVVRLVSGGPRDGVGRGEDGLASAELVILVPVLLAVIGLAVIGGRITTAEGQVHSAVRAAARAASLQRDPADAQAAADQAAQSDLATAGVSCRSYSLQFTAGPPGGVDRATLSCVVPLGGVEWMNVAPSKTIVESFSSPVDPYRQGT